MYLILCFAFGIANFAMHKAVIESGHPFVEDTKLYFGRYLGKSGSYILEFGILLSALFFAQAGSLIAMGFYLAYTLMNLIATWLLMTGRM
jgi:hypothetical protein